MPTDPHHELRARLAMPQIWQVTNKQASDLLADHDALRAEVVRLRQALKVCEEALHRTDVVGGATNYAAAHAAQQASGAWSTNWQPDDASVTDAH